jgi:molybdenum cofactor cytidylyltransferase
LSGNGTLQHTAAIILAAGTSSRMGLEKNKLLLPLHGRPVLVHVIEATLRSQARPVILVLGHQATEVRAQIQPYLTTEQPIIVENPAYQFGMSTSIHTGLHFLFSSLDASTTTNTHITTINGYKKHLDSVLFLLGDQPLMSETIIDRLLDLHVQSGKGIVLPLYRGQRGNPVLFSLELVGELLAVQGDEGGRSVIKRHPESIATLEVDEPGADLDVDTWEAYLQLQAIWEQERSR